MKNRPPIDGMKLVADQVAAASPRLIRELQSTFIHTLMSAEADAVCSADYRKRSRRRANSRNGYRRRALMTRAGKIDLAIPKLRFGSYFPQWILGPGQRAENAITNAAITCYLLGVSRQRITALVESLGLESLSTSQIAAVADKLEQSVDALRNKALDSGPYRFVAVDALTLSVHRQGRISHVQLLIATGLNAKGYSEILGAYMCSAENQDRWLTFFRNLGARGLSGVALVTGHYDADLIAAIDATMPEATWQRCTTHYITELMAITPTSCWSRVRQLVKSIFDQPDVDSVAAQYDRVFDILSEALPEAAKHFEAAREELLGYTAFPDQLWRQIWLNNPCALRRCGALS
ncbi:IS256 family transposase [Mycobacterium camsae]|uniref:IS256 family transposase n=1 Tax=Mycobacterium gordonae TaxID=1778 RepID=UPI0019821CEB|nr:IS256 family transposase [Mycobacterium gordonae]